MIRFPAIMDENEDGSDPTGRKLGESLTPRRSIEEFRAIEAEDPLKFAGQFQGVPRPDGGTIFSKDDFKLVERWEVPQLAYWARAWDLATSVKESADYTAGALIAVNKNLDIYIKNVTRVRAEFPDARKLVIQTAVDDGVEVPVGVEEKVAGLALVQDLQRVPELVGHTIYPMPAKGDKKQRALGWAARARMGHLYLVKPGPGEPDWITPFVNECLAFDGLGLTHDDQVDAVSICWALMHMLHGGTFEQPRTIRPGSPEYYEELAKQQGADPEAWDEPEPDF